jgi:hypothetical protein
MQLLIKQKAQPYKAKPLDQGNHHKDHYEFGVEAVLIVGHDLRQHAIVWLEVGSYRRLWIRTNPDLVLVEQMEWDGRRVAIEADKQQISTKIRLGHMERFSISTLAII